MSRDTDNVKNDKNFKKKLIKSLGIATTLATMTSIGISELPLRRFKHLNLNFQVLKPGLKILLRNLLQLQNLQVDQVVQAVRR